MSLNDYNDPNEVWRRTGYNPYKGMDEKERIKTGCLQGLVLFIMAMVGLLLCALLQGCTTTKYVPIPEYHTDTLRQVTVRHDSVMVHDSIHVTEKGDTVRIERWHTQYRDRWRTDTIYQSKTDSIPYPVEVVKEVPAELSTWQSFRMTLGTIAICLLVLYFIYRIIRKRFFP